MSQGIGYGGGAVSRRPSQRRLLEMIQRGDSFVYALLTRDGAVKIGVSTNLMTRKNGIGFGGVERFLAYRPGIYADEQALHKSIPKEYRIIGTREYYYPAPEMLAFINPMREWMGVKPLTKHKLPRLAECKFHRLVMERETAIRRKSERRSA